MCCRRGSRKKSQNPVCWYDRRTHRSKCKRKCAFTPFESNVHLKLRVLQKCNGAPFFLKYISPWAKRYFITLIRSQLCWCLELYSRSKSNRVQLFGLSNARYCHNGHRVMSAAGVSFFFFFHHILCNSWNFIVKTFPRENKEKKLEDGALFPLLLWGVRCNTKSPHVWPTSLTSVSLPH